MPIRTHRTARSPLIPFGLAAACAIVLAAGCAQRELSDRRLAARERGVQNTLAVWKRGEADAPRRVDRTLGVAGQQLDRDVQKTEAAPARIGGWIDFDTQRWMNNQPVYRRHIENQLHGKPDEVEPHAIILFW
ncbi:MAG: hypothetical protein IPM64_01225 [Phycisphaerales bacterium]|nr:hypothetical protein [Phycisphaerales bacterium]